MKYSTKDIIIGFVIIVLIVGGVFYYRGSKKLKNLPTSTPVSFEFKKELEDNFKYDIPDDSDAVELKDVSGGNGRGIATRNEILADLDNPEDGFFYQAWLKNGGEPVSIGKLISAKGGWLIEYNKGEYSEYKEMIISLEKNFDSMIEKKVLEGSFK